MKQSTLFVCFVLCFVSVLAGCGSSDTSATATRDAERVRLVPKDATPIFAGVCQDDSYVLENWLGTANAQFANLTRYVDDALKQDRYQQGGFVEVLVNMRNTLVALEAPDCVQSTHLLLLNSLDVGLEAVKAHSRGEFTRVNTLKSTFETQRTTLTQQLTLLGEMLQAMIEE